MIIKYVLVKYLLIDHVSHVILRFAIFSIRSEDLEITGVLDPAHGHIELTMGKEIIL